METSNSIGWPAAFARPKDALIAGGCLLTWGGILAILAMGNQLLYLKQLILIIAGARVQPLISAESLQSADIAVVLFCALMVVAAGYVHVSVGLAVVLALRPWLDGFTYPADNAYFLWASFYLLGLWGIRQYRDPKPFRGTLPLMLLGAYLLYATVGALASIQPYSTYIDSQLWLGYGALLLVTINGTSGSPQARGVVMFGLLLGVLGQALFAFPHLYYVLPWLRESLQSNPEMLSRWFKGATEFTPELARRFNLNRAFASMVFPNALAALLLLGIPVAAAWLVEGVRGWRATRSRSKPTEPARFMTMLVVAVPLYVVVALVAFALGYLCLTYKLQRWPWFGSVENLAVLSAIIAALPTTAFLLAGRHGGMEHGLRVLQTLLGLFATPLMIGALWITYSRGAMLALMLSTLITVALLWLGRRKGSVRSTSISSVASLLLLLTMGGGVLLATMLPGKALAANDAETPARTVQAEGMDMTITEMANPASFSARLGYWRVALRIVREHPLLGVGLGNFGMAYGPEQDIDAGDVRNAHSVLLQNLCEVGIPGFLLFVAFWGYFLWRALQRLRDRSTPLDLSQVALIVSLLAFLIHATIDINFSHPSLVMMAMAALGLFYGRNLPSETSGQDWGRRAGAMVLVLGAAVSSGVVMRPFLQSLGLNGGKFINVSDRNWTVQRQDAAQVLIVQSAIWARNGKEGRPPQLPLSEMASLIPDTKQVYSLAKIFAPDSTGAWREVGPTDPIYGKPVAEIKRPWDTHAIAMERLEQWADEMAFLDARFPHDPFLALTLSRIYKLMVEQASERQADRKEGYISKMERWAQVALHRSPLFKDSHQNMAWVYWTMAPYRMGQESIDCYMKALDEFERAQELGHLEPGYYFAYAGALEAIGKSYGTQGLTDEATRYATQSAEIHAAGEAIQRERWGRGLQ